MTRLNKRLSEYNQIGGDINAFLDKNILRNSKYLMETNGTNSEKMMTASSLRTDIYGTRASKTSTLGLQTTVESKSVENLKEKISVMEAEIKVLKSSITPLQQQAMSNRQISADFGTHQYQQQLMRGSACFPQEYVSNQMRSSLGPLNSRVTNNQPGLAQLRAGTSQDGTKNNKIMHNSTQFSEPSKAGSGISGANPVYNRGSQKYSLCSRCSNQLTFGMQSSGATFLQSAGKENFNWNNSKMMENSHCGQIQVQYSNNFEKYQKEAGKVTGNSRHQYPEEKKMRNKKVQVNLIDPKVYLQALKENNILLKERASYTERTRDHQPVSCRTNSGKQKGARVELLEVKISELIGQVKELRRALRHESKQKDFWKSRFSKLKNKILNQTNLLTEEINNVKHTTKVEVNAFFDRYKKLLKEIVISNSKVLRKIILLFFFTF